VTLDLGSIGKGYAIDRAIDLLRENGVANLLLHGGTSSVYALGHAPDGQAWRVAIPHPSRDEEEHLLQVPLSGTGLAVSAPYGKAFERNGVSYGHVIDPRSGEPVSGRLLAAVVSPSAAEGDALSTALLVLGAPGPAALKRWRPECRSVLVTAGAGDGFDVAVDVRLLPGNSGDARRV
jgi:thiamine biosynthesis lipoprotein